MMLHFFPPMFSQVQKRLSLEQSRKKYRHLASKPSSKRTRRKYVEGALYRNIYFEKVVVIDWEIVGDVDLLIQTSQGPTVITIRNVGQDNNLDKLVALDKTLPKDGNARNKGKGKERGEMFALGKRPGLDLEYAPTRAQATKIALLEALPFVRTCLQKYFSQALREMCEYEQKLNIIPCKCMGGLEQGITSRMIISKDLGNSCHFDVNDGSTSISIWVEIIPHQTTNCWLMFPNVTFIDQKDGLQKAIMIKLFHGVGIAWDGTILKHNTSCTNVGKDNHIFGNFFCSVLK